MKKQVILFKTHFINSDILNEFMRIKNTCDVLGYDIFLLHDNTQNNFKLENINSFLFTIEDFKKSGYSLAPKSYLPEGKSIQWFHADFPTLFFYNKNKKYDYYWQIEFDVRFNGDWKDFFLKFDITDSDFIANDIETVDDTANCIMWPRHNLDIDKKKLLKSPFSIIRFSNRALEIVDIEYRNGVVGYCEIIFPTILNAKGLKLQEFGKDFCTRTIFQYYYSISEWFYRIIKVFPIYKNKLFHPIRKAGFSGSVMLFVELKVGKFLKSNIPYIYKLIKPYFPDR